MTAHASDRRARSAFQTLVTLIAAPGARVYDFGAGTGIDARFYSEHGYTVGAYDAEPLMRQSLAKRCRDLLDEQRVTLDAVSYAEFLTSPTLNGGRPADLIVANFAPLNLVADLPALFRRFHSLLAPDGLVIASVLSPYFVGDLRCRWWWRNAGRLWRDGSYAIAGRHTPVIRRRLVAFASQCAPYFVLAGVFTGPPRGTQSGRQGMEWVHRSPFDWMPGIAHRYMFLVFRRGA